MARPLRIEFAGAWYHVMNRGAGRKCIYPSPAYFSLFLELLREIHERYHVQTHAYCLMGNHYHLLLHTPQANLSRAMRHVDGVYTQRHNRLLQTDGPLFRGRYKAILVDAADYLAQLSRYIHRNPLEARLTHDPLHYQWSSYGAYLGQRSAPDWLYRNRILGLFGDQHPQKRYQIFVELGVDEELRRFYAQPRVAPMLGNESFGAQLAARMSTLHNHREIPDTRRLNYRPEIAVIIATTAQHFGIDEKTMCVTYRGRSNIPRAVAMRLCRTPAGYPLNEIAAAFGARSYTTVAMAIQRLAPKLADAALATKVANIKDELFGVV